MPDKYEIAPRCDQCSSFTGGAKPHPFLLRGATKADETLVRFAPSAEGRLSQRERDCSMTELSSSAPVVGDWIFCTIAAQLREPSWMPALVALGLTTGFSHYLPDRSVFRMSDPQVRQAASGLLDRAGKVCREKHKD